MSNTKQAILARLQDGETPTAIAKALDVTPAYVGKVRKATQSTIEWLEDELKTTFNSKRTLEFYSWRRQLRRFVGCL